MRFGSPAVRFAVPRGSQPHPARPVRVVTGPAGEYSVLDVSRPKKCETLYSPAGPVQAGPVQAVTGPTGEYSVLNVLRPKVRNPVYSPARPFRAVTGPRSRCFKAQKCETLYSPAGPVRAVTGPAGEYSVLNVLRPKSAKPWTPRGARPSGDRPRGGVQRSQFFKA